MGESATTGDAWGALVDANWDTLDNPSFFPIGTGDNIDYGTAVTAQRLAVKKGVTASPDTSVNPLIKVERKLSIAQGAIAGDGATQLAGIFSYVFGDAANQVQPVGIYGLASNRGTTPGVGSAQPDAVGLYGLARIINSGVGTAVGGFFNGRRETATGNACGVEVACDNETATAGTYDPANFPTTSGIWIHAVSSNCSVGIAIGNPSAAKFDVGLGFLSQGTGGPIISASIRDDSSAVTVLDINGSHTDILDTQGATISGKLFKITTPGTYTVTNPTTDRALNVTGDTLPQVAEVLGTLIADLQTLGLIS